MRRIRLLAVAVAIASVGAPVEAQQTETHFYDVHGRLQAAAKAPAVGGSVSRYALDNADNRSGRLKETAPQRSVVHELQSRQFILVSQFIPSAHGRFSVVVQQDGNVVLYGPAGAMWVAPWTWGRGSTTLTMQTDGNLTVRGPQNELIWQSGAGAIPERALSCRTTAISSFIRAGRPFGTPALAATNS